MILKVVPAQGKLVQNSEEKEEKEEKTSEEKEKEKEKKYPNLHDIANEYVKQSE